MMTSSFKRFNIRVTSVVVKSILKSYSVKANTNVPRILITGILV